MKFVWNGTLSLQIFDLLISHIPDQMIEKKNLSHDKRYVEIRPLI